MAPQVGEVVHYYPREGAVPCAAMVTRVWPDTGAGFRLNLQVFTDGTNGLLDGFSQREGESGSAWRTSVARRTGGQGVGWEPRPSYEVIAP